MADQILPLNQDINVVVHEIGDLLATAQSNVARQMNNELLSTYWNIGRIIAEYEQTVPERADYGKQTLKELSNTDQRVRQGLFCLRHSVHAAVLSDLPDSTDSVC